jgi:chromosomal replication initiation ATPase DnaA
MYLSHVGLGMSLSRVAFAFERDRSTVAHACHRIEEMRDDLAFDNWLEALEQGVATVAPLLAQAA